MATNVSMIPWTHHSPFTRPGRFAAELAALDPSVGAAIKTVQGILIHGGALEHYGLMDTTGASRETLPVEARLADVHARWTGSLFDVRPAAARSVGTCRDFALLLCAVMRSHMIPARMRCGFASYFSDGPWEDHWLCEVWTDGRWVRVDAQLDAVHREWLGISFDPCDVPPDVYLTADEAWRRSRSGRLDPDTLGHGDAKGLWFVYVNLVRDRLALVDCLSSDWDSWRAANCSAQTLDAETIALSDGLAQESDESDPPLPAPWWL